VKYKKPAQYYFRWDTGLKKGREVIFASGKYDDKIIAHPGGVFKFMTLRLDPQGYLALKENPHSLQNSGLEKIIRLIQLDVQRAQKNNPHTVQLIDEAYMDGRKVWVVQGQFPQNEGYYARKVILFIDKTLCLPIRVSIYNWSDKLVEEYIFRDLRINVGIADTDFRIDNPDYHFNGIE
jgi:hypothetical protein